MAEKNLGASVRSQLKNKAQAENKEFYFELKSPKEFIREVTQAL